MLNFYDEDGLILWGWKSFSEVFGEIPGLEDKLQQFLYEQMNAKTFERIAIVVHDHLRSIGIQWEDWEVETWSPPGTGRVVLVARRRGNWKRRV